jgi:hypothetical protein
MSLAILLSATLFVLFRPLADPFSSSPVSLSYRELLIFSSRSFLCTCTPFERKFSPGYSGEFTRL